MVSAKVSALIAEFWRRFNYIYVFDNNITIKFLKFFSWLIVLQTHLFSYNFFPYIYCLLSPLKLTSLKHIFIIW